MGVSPTPSRDTSCHMAPSVASGTSTSGSGGDRRGVGVVGHVTGGEAGLDEASQGIHNVPKDLGGVFLHVVAHTERPKASK